MKKPKRAKNPPSARAVLRGQVATYVEMADETAAHEATAATEREKLRASRDRFKSCVADLINVIDGYDAMVAGEPWTKPTTSSGLVLLSMVLHEAFTIGKFVTINPITQRIHTFDATQTKVSASKRTDDLVRSEFKRVSSEHPRLNARRTADTMRDPLNAKLVEAGLKGLAVETIRKRIGRLIKSGTIDDRPKNTACAPQSFTK